MATTRHDADIINADRHEQAELMKARLDRMGVAIRMLHATGDSSWPTTYELIYGTIRAAGPTMDMAVADFIEKLLKRFGDQALP